MKSLREQLGWSAAEFAAFMGVGVSTVYRWEAGAERIDRRSVALATYLAGRAMLDAELGGLLSTIMRVHGPLAALAVLLEPLNPVRR